MEQKSPDEFVRRKGHGFLLIVIAVVSPVEFHLAIFNVDNPMIRNGHSVRVAADIVHDLLRPSERWLGVDDPFRVSQRIEMIEESLPILERLKRSEEVQLVGVEGLLQILEKQSAEQPGEHLYRQEKIRAAGDPVCTIR